MINLNDPLAVLTSRLPWGQIEAAVAAKFKHHNRADHRMDRCWLKGSMGDALYSISCAAGYNLRWLLRAIARLGIGAVFFASVAASAVTAAGRRDVIRSVRARVDCDYVLRPALTRSCTSLRVSSRWASVR